MVVSFLEIYCDRVRDLGEAYMSHGEREIDGLKTTSDIYRRMKSVRYSISSATCPRSPLGFHSDRKRHLQYSWFLTEHPGTVWLAYLDVP